MCVCVCVGLEPGSCAELLLLLMLLTLFIPRERFHSASSRFLLCVTAPRGACALANQLLPRPTGTVSPPPLSLRGREREREKLPPPTPTESSKSATDTLSPLVIMQTEAEQKITTNASPSAPGGERMVYFPLVKTNAKLSSRPSDKNVLNPNSFFKK